jgi:hypothetical protein
MITVRCNDVILGTYDGYSFYQGATGRMAIVIFDGMDDLYAIDDGANLSAVADEIKRKYRDDYSREPESITFYGRIPYKG